jgi:hypothetical protein
VRKLRPITDEADLPPWSGNDPAMREWLCKKIKKDRKAQYAAYFSDQKRRIMELVAALEAKFTAVEAASPYFEEIIEAKLFGDLEPIKARLPDLAAARMLCLPPMKHGKKRPRQMMKKELLRLMAAGLVPSINKYWLETWGTRIRKVGEASALSFAADIINGTPGINESDKITDEDVRLAMRRINERKPAPSESEPRR